MTVPSSSAPLVPPPTFQTPNGTEGASPKDLRDFLRSLRDNELQKDDIPSTLVQDRQPWLKLVGGLLEHVFGCFPYFKPSIQGTTNERIELTDVSLEVFSCIGKRVDLLYVDEEHLTREVFVHLLGLCISAESWLEVANQSESGGLPLPNTLYPKACDTLVDFLQNLSFLTSRGTYSGVQVGALHEILYEVTNLCTGEFNSFVTKRLLNIRSNDLYQTRIISS